MISGGGVYDTKDRAIAAAKANLGSHAELDKDFGVYPANSNPKVWIWEIPPRVPHERS